MAIRRKEMCEGRKRERGGGRKEEGKEEGRREGGRQHRLIANDDMKAPYLTAGHCGPSHCPYLVETGAVGGADA